MRAGRSAEWVVRTGLHSPSYTLPHLHRAATKPRRALLVLNLPSFRSMEHTTPSASNRDGDALATTPPFADDPRAVQ